MRPYSARLSGLIDRAALELEDAEPETVATWRRVLAELEKAAGL